MQRRSVLYLHPSAELYGSDRTLLDLVRGEGGRRRVVVAVPRDGPLVAHLERAGATVEFVPLGTGLSRSLSPAGLLALALALPSAILAVRRLVRTYDVELVHTNTMVVLGGALGAWLSRARHVWHVHEIPTRPRWLATGFALLFRLLAQRVVFNSYATQRAFVERHAGLARKSSVVWNGTAVQRQEGDALQASRLRMAHGVPQDAPLVLLLGRINAWKGQQLFVAALRRLHEQRPDVRAWIVGGTPPGRPEYLDALMEAIHAAGLDNSVCVHPFGEEVGPFLAAADVVAVPSTRPEPFGLVVLEAMAHAKPVVVAAHGGPLEIVEHGQTGLHVTPGDADALAAGLAQVLDDPAHARALGAAGLERQRAHFSIDTYVRGVHDVHAACLGATTRVKESERIVHVVLGKANPERMNGVNVVVHHLAAAQRRAGFDVEVWGLTDTSTAGGPRPYALRLFERGRNRFSVTRELRAALDALDRPCVFHLHGGFLPELAALARRLRRRGHAYVVSPHGAYRRAALQTSGWRKRVYLALFERRLLAGARSVQAFAARDAEDIARLVQRERIAVVPNGQAELEGTTHESAPERRARSAGPVFGFCGRLRTYVKGLDLLIDGFEQHVTAGGRGTLVLIGDGPDRAALERRVQDAGLGERVRFEGALFDAARLAALHELDVFVLTSRHEGMPTGPLEAGAAGLPLLVSEETNLADVVRAERCGFVPSEATAAGIAAAMELADAQHSAGALRATGLRAARAVRRTFSWDRISRLAARDLYGLRPARDELTSTSQEVA